MSISVRMVWHRIRRIKSDELLFYVLVVLFFSMPLGTSPPAICGVLAVLIWIFAGKVGKLRHTCFTKGWFWPVLLLMVLPWVGLLYTPDPAGLGIKFAKKTHYWIYCMVVASIPFGILRPQRLIQGFLVGLGLNSIVAIMQLAGIFPMIGEISFGLVGYNTLSAYLVLGVLMVSYYFRVANQRKMEILCVFLMALYFFHLIIIEGRGGYLTFFLLCPLIVRNLSKGLSFLKISLACVLLVGIMFLSPVVRDRVSLSIEQLRHHFNADLNTAWGKNYTVHQDRFYMWYGAIKIFLKNPFFGVGTGGYQTVLKKMGKPEWPAIAHPHNNILYMAVSFGLIGIFALLWFFWEIFRNSWEERHTPLGFFVLSAALVIFVGGLVNTHIKDAGTLFLLATVTGLQNGFRKFSHSEQEGISEKKDEGS